jgi:DNA-binding transcriptional ArsR family regulator
MPVKHEICNSGTSIIAHVADVSRVQERLPSDEEIYELSDFYKVLGDSTRLKILFALLSSEICVQCLAELLNMNQSAISHQLRVLKQSRLVKFRKEGKFKFYSLDDEHVSQMMVLGMSHLTEGVD